MTFPRTSLWNGTRLVLTLVAFSASSMAFADSAEDFSVLTNLGELGHTVSDSANSIEASIQPIKNSGRVEIFRERYPNGDVRIEREVTVDSDGNYVNNGQWKMWDPTGLLIADGQYSMGKRVGSWTRILDRKDSAILRQAPFNHFKAPFTSNVTFKDDKMDGDWLMLDMEQRKCSQISIANGVRHGMAVTWLPNGNVLRQAQYEQGVPTGEVLQANSTTGELERVATYLDGRRIASNVDYFTRAKRQKKTEEMFLAPKTVLATPDKFWESEFATYDQDGEPLRHGLAKAWYENGQLQSEGQYEYNKRVGHFRFWHPNGQISAEGEFENDGYTGYWVWWFENGQKAIYGSYEEGRYVGEWRWWNELGQLADRQVYDGTEGIAPAEVERTSQQDLPQLRLTK